MQTQMNKDYIKLWFFFCNRWRRSRIFQRIRLELGMDKFTFQNKIFTDYKPEKWKAWRKQSVKRKSKGNKGLMTTKTDIQAWLYTELFFSILEVFLTLRKKTWTVWCIRKLLRLRAYIVTVLEQINVTHCILRSLAAADPERADIPCWLVVIPTSVLWQWSIALVSSLLQFRYAGYTI
jgi:hypothetical protein